MPFTLEEMTDFDQKIISDGAGWSIVSEIWLGISLRAKITNNQIQLTEFSKQFSGPIWIQKQAWATGRNELPTMLNQMYSAILYLLDSGITEFGGARWTESSGRSSEWTIESITADIGLGPFGDLLTRPQNPAALLWLVQALKRLIHPKIYRPLYYNDLVWVAGNLGGGRYYHYLNEADIAQGETSNSAASDSVQLQGAWSSLGSIDYASPYTWEDGSIGCSWAAFGHPSGGPYTAKTVKKITNIALARKIKTGYPDPPFQFVSGAFTKPLTINCIDYKYRIESRYYNGPDLVVKIGSSPETNIGKTYTPYNVDLFLESEGPDLDFAGNDSVALEILTERPSTVPFSVFNQPLNSDNARISVSLSMACVYCDLPEVMGAGELTAPEPTIGGAASQEE